MAKLTGSRAVVIGAGGAGNMGQVICRRLADEGATVLVAGRNQAPISELAAEIGGVAATCDITSKEDVGALLSQTHDKLGGCNIAINATGKAIGTPTPDITEQEIDELSALHIKGVYNFIQTFGTYMAENGGGSIVQISSATTVCPVENNAIYMATKGGGDQLVKAFALELGPHGVKVNSVAPGFTETPMTSPYLQVPGLRNAFEARYPLGRIGTSEDVANGVIWLSEKDSFITGEVLNISGGLPLRGNPIGKEFEVAAHEATAE